MKREILFGLVCALTIAGCSTRPPDKVQAASDSIRTAPDSPGTAPAGGKPLILSARPTLRHRQPLNSLQLCSPTKRRQGAVVFTKYCAVCHGQEGKGDGFNAFNLDPRPRDLSDSVAMRSLSDDQILRTITGGGRSVNKSPLMPAYGWTLNPQQIHYVAAYIRALSRPL